MKVKIIMVKVRLNGVWKEKKVENTKESNQ
jgi:hypothetical protein